MWYHYKQQQQGFTLIEMIVSLAVFTVVVLIGVGSLISIVHSNRKAQAQKTVMNNLNFAIESMTRTIRIGTTYHCGEGGTLDEATECPTTAANAIAFEAAGGDTGSVNDQVVYRLQQKAIERSLDGGTNYLAITAPEVEIDRLDFYVDGNGTGDNEQPRVLIVLEGHAGTTTVQDRSDFRIQTFVTHRLLDN